MNSPNAVFSWIQRGGAAILAVALTVLTYTPSIAQASDNHKSMSATNATFAASLPTSKTYAPKRLGGTVKITRSTKNVRVTLKHDKARKAQLSAFSAQTRSWSAAARGKATSKRASWSIPSTSNRILLRVGGGKSVLAVPGRPKAKQTPPIAGDPGPSKDPTPAPSRKTPPGPAPWEGFDWDDWNWENFRCDYEAAKGYSEFDEKYYLYAIFCDGPTTAPGGAGTIVEEATLSSCAALDDGASGAVYEVTYPFALADLPRVVEPAFTTYAWMGRDNVRIHDIEPGSAHLNANGELAYTARTRSIPATQKTVDVTLPFHDSVTLLPDWHWVGERPPLSVQPENAYETVSHSSPRLGDNMRPIVSWTPVATYFRPQDWEKTVWGVSGVNGRTTGVGYSKILGSYSDFVRKHNTSLVGFAVEDIPASTIKKSCL